ncbi:uncharacterized protein LOC106640011 [Copidosoma floridanum]|uniref:uncharacterized protein LOC106640011 n=1 Tax=Copidosoma floridanum TaxID=29053 RepID=UPI0006C98285|nr:uncharacterized protein LOC106640011 [Copidosoma floridanum]
MANEGAGGGQSTAPQQLASDREKYDLVVSSLDTAAISNLIDILSSPLDTDLFGNLKKANLNHMALSQDKQLDLLFNKLELGDKTPLQLLRYMRTSVHNQISDELLKVKWLKLMAPHVARILKVLKTSTLVELSAAADELVKFHSSVFSLTQKVISAPTATPPTANATLAQSITALSLQVSQLSTAVLNRSNDSSHQPRQRQHSESRSRPKADQAQAANDVDFCWYHVRFGVKARNCEILCTLTLLNNLLKGLPKQQKKSSLSGHSKPKLPSRALKPHSPTQPPWLFSVPMLHWPPEPTHPAQPSKQRSSKSIQEAPRYHSDSY